MIQGSSFQSGYLDREPPYLSRAVTLAPATYPSRRTDPVNASATVVDAKEWSGPGLRKIQIGLKDHRRAQEKTNGRDTHTSFFFQSCLTHFPVAKSLCYMLKYLVNTGGGRYVSGGKGRFFVL